MILTEVNEPVSSTCSSSGVRTRLLEQMAEALEDEAAVLYRRAAAFEEEEFLLSREIDERQTEINRLQLKLDAMRAERDRVIELIETISEEANAMRDQASNPELPSHPDEDVDPDAQALYFRRAKLDEQPGLA